MKLKKDKDVVDKKLTLSEVVNDQVDSFMDDTDNLDPNNLVSLIAVSELTNLDKIELVSRIKPEQVASLTKLGLYADTFNVPFLKDLRDNILQLQVSINGLGRKELVRVVNQSIGSDNDMELHKKKVNIFR